jgi:hypothetical protein
MSLSIKIILALLVAGASVGGYAVYRQHATVEVVVEQPAQPPVAVQATQPEKQMPAGDIRTIPKVKY